MPIGQKISQVKAKEQFIIIPVEHIGSIPLDEELERKLRQKQIKKLNKKSKKKRIKKQKKSRKLKHVKKPKSSNSILGFLKKMFFIN